MEGHNQKRGKERKGIHQRILLNKQENIKFEKKKQRMMMMVFVLDPRIETFKKTCGMGKRQPWRLAWGFFF